MFNSVIMSIPVPVTQSFTLSVIVRQVQHAVYYYALNRSVHICWYELLIYEALVPRS